MSKIRDKKAFDVHIRSVKQAMEFCDYDNKDFITTRVIRIKKERRHRGTSAKERLLRVLQALGFLRQKRRHLLDKALRSSGVVSDMKRYTESYTARLQPPTEIKTTHSILSETEEVYCVEVHSRKQQSILLKLRMSLCNGELSVRVTAPRRIWLSILLSENYPSPAGYQILDSSIF